MVTYLRNELLLAGCYSFRFMAFRFSRWPLPIFIPFILFFNGFLLRSNLEIVFTFSEVFLSKSPYGLNVIFLWHFILGLTCTCTSWRCKFRTSYFLSGLLLSHLHLLMCRFWQALGVICNVHLHGVLWCTFDLRKNIRLRNVLRFLTLYDFRMGNWNSKEGLCVDSEWLECATAWYAMLNWL